jgi:outer membrane receptor for ferrienterochelin and colicins
MHGPLNKLVLVTAMLMLAAPQAFADDQVCAITGLVTDATGLPLPGSSIAVTGTGAAVADASGKYCITSVVPGRYTVTATLDGYAPHPVEVDVTGGSRTVTFRLSPTYAATVVVTATRTGRRLDDVPVRTELVTRDAIERLGARTLADAVEFTTGVRVETNCQNCNFSQIRLLGLEGPYTQILIDSQPVISSLAQVYGIEQLPARMIERIEVVKGGGSALYGPGSVGGVINIISREPSKTGAVVETRTELSDGLPSYSFNGAADWVDAGRQTFLTAFAQSDLVKPLDLTGDGYTEVSRRQLDAFGARFNRYLLANRAKLTLDALRTSEDRRGGDLLRLPSHEATIAEAIDSRRHAASGTWFHTVSPRFDYRLTWATANTARDSYYGTGRDPNAYGATENLLHVLDTQLNHYAGKHTVSWGLQSTAETLVDVQPAYDRFTDASYRNAGLFAQDDWALGRGWQLVYGLRADRHSSIDAVIVSPRAAVMYSPRANIDIRASIARGFRPPQVFDEDLHLSSVAGEARIIRLAPDLREETSTNYMTGVEWKPVAGRGQALFELNGFYTGLHDQFHVGEADDPRTPEFEFVKANFGDARVYGVELNLGWGIDDWLVFQGGMVEQRARFGQAEAEFGSRDFFRTPHRYGNASVTWKHRVLGDYFAGLRYTGPMKAPHYAGFIAHDRLDTTPSFVTFDMSVSRPIVATPDRRLVVTVAGRNLTNEYQDDLDQGPLRDAAYVYGPRFPRSVSLGLRVEF